MKNITTTKQTESIKTIKLWIEYDNEVWTKELSFQEGNEDQIVEDAQEDWFDNIGCNITNFDDILYDMGWDFVN